MHDLVMSSKGEVVQVNEVEKVGWQPIESAPKDGTRILLWCVHPNAKYADNHDDLWAGAVIGSWTDHNGGGWTWSGHSGTHTHWMPLPDPPTHAREATA